jgi:hypothetical protein
VGSERKKKKGKGGGEADRRGPGVSVAGRKRKRRGEEVGRCGEARWAAGPSGLEGKPARFSFFSFSNFIFKPFFISNSNQTFSNFFSRIFMNFLETTQATKNNASQLMMHKHLLSLSLLNYI